MNLSKLPPHLARLVAAMDDRTSQDRAKDRQARATGRDAELILAVAARDAAKSCSSYELIHASFSAGSGVASECGLDGVDKAKDLSEAFTRLAQARVEELEEVRAILAAAREASRA